MPDYVCIVLPLQMDIRPPKYFQAQRNIFPWMPQEHVIKSPSPAGSVNLKLYKLTNPLAIKA